MSSSLPQLQASPAKTSTRALPNFTDIKVEKRPTCRDFIVETHASCDCVSLELSWDLWAPSYPSDSHRGIIEIVFGR